MARTHQSITTELKAQVAEMHCLINAQRAKEGEKSISLPEFYQVMADHYKAHMQGEGYGIE